VSVLYPTNSSKSSYFDTRFTRFWETSLSPSRRQFYCASCQRYFTERLDFAGWERRYTHRYEAYIYQKIQSSSLEQIAREEGLSFDQVQGIFNHQNAQKKPRTGEGLGV